MSREIAFSPHSTARVLRFSKKIMFCVDGPLGLPYACEWKPHFSKSALLKIPFKGTGSLNDSMVLLHHHVIEASVLVLIWILKSKVPQTIRKAKKKMNHTERLQLLVFSEPAFPASTSLLEM